MNSNHFKALSRLFIVIYSIYGEYMKVIGYRIQKKKKKKKKINNPA